MINKKRPILALSLIALLLSTSAIGQRKAAKAAPKARDIIFAVLNDGKTLEPIAVVDKGELLQIADSQSETAAAFGKEFYRTKTRYKIIFGGAANGSATVVSSNPQAECSAYMATVRSVLAKGKLGGKVMALATNAAGSTKAKFMRRMPTAAERTEAEALVRSEFAKSNVTAKQLFSHNLTAIDVDHNGIAELVGSYYVKTDPKTRALLFFIAEKNADGDYGIASSTFSLVKEDEVMNGDISTVDEGIYNELLLDSFEYDGDDMNEIFTYTQSFEGAGFKAYSKREGKWVVAFEASNYHCAF